MNPCTLENCILIIFASPALEETLVDWLLENEAVSGFSTVHGFGHGSRPSAMSLLEQVAGRQRRIEFKIETTHATSKKLIEEIRQAFSGTGLHYIVVPIFEAGRL